MDDRTLKEKLRHIIFGTDTPAGRIFDVALLLMIIISVLAVILESIPSLAIRYTDEFHTLEWIITAVFTVEYILRVYIAYDKRKYVLGFWGLIDLVSILPAYLSLLLAGYHYFMIVRILRLLRIFRIFKMIQFIREIRVMLIALRGSARKILVFLSFVILMVIILGSGMYVAEGHQNGFTSIPASVYWAIVTITTVGYGDIVPLTIAGKTIASLIMLLGYSIIAVPTGVVSVEFARAMVRTGNCRRCATEVSPEDIYCRHCGTPLKKTGELTAGD